MAGKRARLTTIQRPPTVTATVADSVRTAILGGSLRPGEPLREIALSSTLGVSRSAVREALQLLAHEGLVRHEPHRGAHVATLTAQDVVDIMRFRRALEVAGIEASRKAPAELRAAVDTALEGLAAATATTRVDRWVEADLAFHRQLAALVGSGRLDRASEGLYQELRLALVAMSVRYALPARILAEHAEIADAIRARKRSRAVKLLNEHLDDSERVLVHIFRSGAA